MNQCGWTICPAAFRLAMFHARLLNGGIDFEKRRLTRWTR